MIQRFKLAWAGNNSKRVIIADDPIGQGDGFHAISFVIG
jgi:ABC-type lipoprotein export system ATPase subunit